MSKFLKVLILIVFVAGAVILLNQTLFSSGGAGGDCFCWNETAAENWCITACAQFGGCSYVCPKVWSGVCSGTKCIMDTYYRCANGQRGFVHVSSPNCPDCY